MSGEVVSLAWSSRQTTRQSTTAAVGRVTIGLLVTARHPHETIAVVVSTPTLFLGAPRCPQHRLRSVI